jgi:hypothetical protein
MVVSFDVKFSTLPNADTILFEAFGAGVGAAGMAFKQSDSKIYLQWNSTNYSSSGIAVTTGVVYTINLRVNASGTTWVMDGQVNGVDLPQLTNAFGAAATFADYRIGSTSQSNTWTARFDNFQASHISGDYPLVVSGGVSPGLAIIPSLEKFPPTLHPSRTSSGLCKVRQ